MPKIPFGYLKRLPSTGSGWFAPRVCGTLKTMITSGICNFSSAARNCPSYKLRLYTWRQRIQGPKHERSRAQTHLSATNKHWGSLSNHLFYVCSWSYSRLRDCVRGSQVLCDAPNLKNEVLSRTCQSTIKATSCSLVVCQVGGIGTQRRTGIF